MTVTGGLRAGPQREVVESYERDRVAAGQFAQARGHADRDQVLGGEQRGWPRAVHAASPGGCLGGVGLWRSETHELRSNSMPASVSAWRIRRNGRLRSVSASRSPRNAIRVWPVCDQVLRPRPRAAGVVGHDGVGSQQPRRPVGEHEAQPGPLLVGQIALVVAGGRDDQAVNAARSEGEGERPLALGILVDAAGEHRDCRGRLPHPRRPGATRRRRGWRRSPVGRRSCGFARRCCGDFAPSSWAGSPGRWRLAGLAPRDSVATVGSPLITRETVFRLTRANAATSRIVGRARVAVPAGRSSPRLFPPTTFSSPRSSPRMSLQRLSVRS